MIHATNKKDFMIKVSNSTSIENSADKLMQNNYIFGIILNAINRTTAGLMDGYGLNIPNSASYAEYMDGSLQVIFMQWLGTDVIHL